jgi:hypothetical protein
MAAMTASLAGLTLNLRGDAPEPTPDQCLAHLKLLEWFHTLRERVIRTDGVFGLPDSLARQETKWDDPNQASESELLREKRWAVFVTRAVDRFEAWWARCAPSTRFGQPSRRLTQKDMDGSGGKAFEASFQHKFNRQYPLENLPPLGVWSFQISCSRRRT